MVLCFLEFMRYKSRNGNVFRFAVCYLKFTNVILCHLKYVLYTTLLTSLKYKMRQRFRKKSSNSSFSNCIKTYLLYETFYFPRSKNILETSYRYGCHIISTITEIYRLEKLSFRFVRSFGSFKSNKSI